MKNFYILSDAIEYIENNLCEEISQEDIAKDCFCSLSSLQKLFKYVFHISIKEYITKRRLTHAAKDLVESKDSILDIALKYQYNSAEVFTRAFHKIWGVTPSAFRKRKGFTGLFPKIEFNYDGGSTSMASRKFDITELYDELKKRIDNYVLCFDMIKMEQINNISREAGDKAIVECLRRLDENSSEDMLVFRIGGDEFALVTNLKDKEEVEQLASKILSFNGNTIEFENQQIEVSMRVGGIKINHKNVKYNELFVRLNEVIHKTCDLQQVCYIAE